MTYCVALLKFSVFILTIINIQYGAVFKMNYSLDIENMMIKLYKNLNERERRLYAAVEVEKLGYGGKQYLMNLFSCSHHTIDRGLWELKNEEETLKGRIRKKGGGRKKKG